MNFGLIKAIFLFRKRVGLRSPALLIGPKYQLFSANPCGRLSKKGLVDNRGKKQKNCSHLNHVAGRVCVPSNLDLRRLARDLLDGAHEDVRDDRDAQEAGEDISLSNLYILNYILYQGYMDAQKQTWSLLNI